MEDLDYVARIRSARVYDVARVTALDRARRLSDRLGAEIVLKGETYSDAAEEAKRLVVERGLTFIPPYDDPDVIAEAQHILTLLDESFTPSEPLARLMKILRTAVGDGAVSKSQSQEIARVLGETLNLQMTTAEKRRRFMY